VLAAHGPSKQFVRVLFFAIEQEAGIKIKSKKERQEEEAKRKALLSATLAGASDELNSGAGGAICNAGECRKTRPPVLFDDLD
jgi:hypothetical protein